MTEKKATIFLEDDVAALRRVAAMLQSQVGLTPVMAAEIEFYLDGINRHSFKNAVLHDINMALEDAQIRAGAVEEERGESQYEIALPPRFDVEELARDLVRLQTVIAATVMPHDIRVDFRAKPLPDMPGSGLHVHLHLTDSNNRNVFFRDEESERLSPLLKQAIAGMLALLRESMPIFAPTAESYLRYRAYSNAPVNVSWGTNNRTVAIRLPDKPIDNKHIEHRVAGADARPALVMTAMLAGAHYGISNELRPPDAIYGNAWDEHYDLPPLPANLEEAVEYMQQSQLLPKYMGRNAVNDLLRQILYPAAF